MKSILISIKPRHCVNILNGGKKIEIRTTTTKEWKDYLSSKTDVMPEPIECLIYCTKQTTRYYIKNKIYNSMINGKVIAKFTLKKVEETKLNLAMRFFTKTLNEKELCAKTCLLGVEIFNYLEHKTGYAWYIDDLEIFKMPKELSEFYRYGAKDEYDHIMTIDERQAQPYIDEFYKLKKAPQSWCYVESEK